MIVIFLTGAIVLALEVLASRIMTPYFGVSLYIWAGILSITLTFLAVGYYLGGRLAGRVDGGRAVAAFFLLPTVSAAAILLAVPVYPFLFPALAGVDLLFGSFVGSALLLALPLICLSAMNPMLIAINRSRAAAGDGGAGLVFFVSTAGSVAGVLITVFAIIPNLTNFAALLWLALALCLIAGLFAAGAPGLPRAGKLRLAGAAAGVAALAVAFMLTQGWYLRRLADSGDGRLNTQVVGEYSSIFGNIKVVELGPPGGGIRPIKGYIQDGIMQNRTTRQGVSASLYTYVLQSLALGFVPGARSGLVLGLGAGIVPRDFKRAGMAVSVVEINPDSLRAARDHFGFQAADFTLHIQDARTFVRGCRQAFDVVVVDLFQGDSTPDYLLSREFFGDIRRCLGPKGAVVMNAFFDDQDDVPNMRLLATVRTAFGRVFQFREPGGNAFVVGTVGPPPDPLLFRSEVLPGPLADRVRATLATGQRISGDALLGFAPVSDQQNLFSILSAGARMRQRRAIASTLPPHILVN